MVIDQGRERASHQPDAKPNCLAFDEIINVVMAAACKSACAKKHDDADDEHDEHGDE
jgi:hypothetical protein